MQVTVAEYAHMRGVSVATIKWMSRPPEARLETYIDEPAEVFCSVRRYAALLGCDYRTVHYRISRGTLALNENH